jgi:hypothetical protein
MGVRMTLAKLGLPILMLAGIAGTALSSETPAAGDGTTSTTVLIPANSTTVSGLQVLDASASPGATKVTFEISEVGGYQGVVGTAAPTLYGWLVQWNTTTVDNGTYALQSVATFSGGVTQTSPAISITVANVAPATSLLIPSSNVTLSGTTTFDTTTNAVGNSFNTGFVIDGNGLPSPIYVAATRTIYGWLASWNTESLPNGTYTLQSSSTYSPTGLRGVSPTVAITLDNVAPTTSVVLPSSNGRCPASC